MTDIKKEIIINFYKFLKINNVDYYLEDFNHNNIDFKVYTFYYNPQFITFISSFSNLDIFLFNQYLTIKYFEHLLFKEEHRMSIKAFISDDVLHFEIASSEVGTHTISPVAFLYIIYNDTLKVLNVYNNDFNYGFDVLYESILSKIRKTLDPSITFTKMLHLCNKDTLDVLNDKLSAHHIRAITIAEFKSNYVDYSEIFILDGHSIKLNENKFMLFIKDNFPENFYSNIKQITSILCFQEKVCNRGAYIFEHSPFNVILNKTSKFSPINTVYTLIFGLLPNEDRQLLISVYDNGTIEFSCVIDDDFRDLTSLDDIYNYIKEEFIINIENTLSIAREHITTDVLKLYEMAKI